MNPTRLLTPSTYIGAANEAAELINLLRELPRHIDSLALSASRLAEAAETLAAVVEPLVAVQDRIEGPLGLVGDQVRKGRAAMTDLRTAATPRRRPSARRENGPATPPA
jgi:hypothetical protein